MVNCDQYYQPRYGRPHVNLRRIGYRVVAIEGDRLLIRGTLTGDMLTIISPELGTPLAPEDYPPGKSIALTDPSASPLN